MFPRGQKIVIYLLIGMLYVLITKLKNIIDKYTYIYVEIIYVSDVRA